MLNGSRPSHALRIAIFLLRLVLGLDFFYLGFSTLFDRTLAARLATHSLSPLYQWVGIVPHLSAIQTFYAWMFLILGGCILLGFLTRLASIAVIVLTLLAFLPFLNLASLDFSQLASDNLLAAAGCLVLFMSGAGEYIGLDKFIHIRFSGLRGNP